MKKISIKKPSFVKEHERMLMPVFLISGFIIDWITLNRVDQVFDNLILLAYILLSGFSILIFHSQIQNIGSFFRKIKEFSNLLMQYAFGGLFSGLFIFYFRSSSFITSLPFLLILIGLFLGNELFNKKYQRLLFQITVFYVGIFSYSNLIVPILFKRINVWIFMLASSLSLILIYLFIILVKKIIIDPDKTNNIYKIITGVFMLFIILYFTNIIPPIPLSLKQAYVAHDIEKRVGKESGVFYEITTQKNPWYKFWSNYSRNLNVFSGESVYIFSSVFAPTNFKSTIYHQWTHFNPEISRWEEYEKIPIEIVGGRDTGFRGYSLKSNLLKGSWRVDVETERGQVIGRIIFDIKEPKENIELETIWR
jgi:hypothetical protein